MGRASARAPEYANSSGSRRQRTNGNASQPLARADARLTRPARPDGLHEATRPVQRVAGEHELNQLEREREEGTKMEWTKLASASSSHSAKFVNCFSRLCFVSSQSCLTGLEPTSLRGAGSRLLLLLSSMGPARKINSGSPFSWPARLPREKPRPSSDSNERATLDTADQRRRPPRPTIDNINQSD